MSVLMRKLLMRQGVHFDEAGADGGDGGGGGKSGSSGDGGTGDDGKAGSGDDGKGAGDEGKGKPDDEKAKLIKEVMEKKGKIKELTDANAAAAARLKEFDGIDPAAVRQLLADKKSAEDKKLAEAGQWDALKKQMNDAHALEITAERTKTTEATTRNTALEQKIANLTVGNSFGQSTFIREELALTPSKARIVYGPHFEFDGERVVGYDKPAGDASRVQFVDAKGEPLPFEQALKKLIEADPDRDTMLKSKTKTGAASKTEDKGKSAGKTTELSSKDKIAAGLKAGLSK